MAIFGLEKPATPAQLQSIIHNPAYDKNLIGSFKDWRVYIHPNQAYLGRSYAWWAGAGHVDLMDPSDLSKEEIVDLFMHIALRFRAAVQELWGSTHVNYAWFGNETQVHRGRAHLHLIPRYFDEVPEFEGRKFPDKRIGENYAPYSADVLPDELLGQIRDALRESLALSQLRLNV